MSASDSKTSATLLARLRRDPQDREAWAEFVRRYRPKIYGWCSEWGLQSADAEDVAQNVLVKLAETMRHFQYDPARSFRAWLKTVTQHAWTDFVRSRRQQDGGENERLKTLEARADLTKRLADEFDLELMELAMQAVQQRVASQTWEAFRLTALEGLAGAEAAQQLGMTVANLFVAKHRVQKMLREEIRRLEEPGQEKRQLPPPGNSSPAP